MLDSNSCRDGCVVMNKLSEMKKNYKYYLFLFFSISILSWGLELLFSLIFRGKIVNPGSLTLFWCPIYGFSCLLIYLCTKRENHIFLNSIKIFLLAAVVEYLASYISEKFFNNIIWNYSKFFLNINGRICVHMTLLFTAFGLLWLYVIEPWQYKQYDSYKKIFNIFIFIASFAFLVDVFINWI